LEILERFKKAVDEHLFLRSFPVAIKLLERREDIPPNMSRSSQILGETIRPCVGWRKARHDGLSLAMLEEDFSTACPSGLFVLGILEPIPSWIEGNLACDIYTGSREAAANMERHVFRLEAGKYIGIAFAPLGKADFIPDLVMIYGNAKQAWRLVVATAWTTGEPLRVSIAARDLCSEAIVQPFQTGQPVLAIPCGGDRAHGMTTDDEIVFTTPVDKLEGIIQGLEGFEKSHRVKYPGGESKLAKRYKEMAKMLDEKLGRQNS
jgi:uncharacterized protein (DUF169 family)